MGCLPLTSASIYSFSGWRNVRISFCVAVLSCLAASLGCAQSIEAGNEQKALTPDLKPGDYVWQPEVSPAGPVAIIVSLAEQAMYVYRNGVRIGRSTVSSGKDGHKTPTGVFTILEKNVTHHSSAYHEASMPYMERLTWGGVAIHAGNLPGYLDRLHIASVAPGANFDGTPPRA